MPYPSYPIIHRHIWNLRPFHSSTQDSHIPKTGLDFENLGKSVQNYYLSRPSSLYDQGIQLSQVPFHHTERNLSKVPPNSSNRKSVVFLAVSHLEDQNLAHSCIKSYVNHKPSTDISWLFYIGDMPRLPLIMKGIKSQQAKQRKTGLHTPSHHTTNPEKD